MLQAALILLFPFLMMFAASTDLLSMTISNKVSLALMAGFCVCAYALGMPLLAFAWHWLLFVLVLAIGFSLFAFGVMGGGDAKLAAATALWLGWEHTFTYVLIASLIGGALTLLLLSVRSVPLPSRMENVGWIVKLYRADTGIPYGIALAAAAMIVYPDTVWMQHVFAMAHLR